jgi:membrane fusion protein, macrolide-specific efflux system
MKNKIIITAMALILAGAGMFLLLRSTKAKNGSKDIVKEIKPVYGNIQILIAATGTVQPQNRLEIKPAINGRVEEILVEEGDKVKKGQVLAMMSSEDRAALLDAASSQGEEAVKYWSQVYKQVPLTAPIDGEVIVRGVEPGQSVTTSTAILVLSDRLIVDAQVDETDIGRIKVGQKVIITLDAYPKDKIKAVVDHVAYESKLVNNVTTYDVEILPESVPEFFRSGMSANVEIVEQGKENVLLIPIEALIRKKDESFVKLAGSPERGAELKRIETGISDDVNTEVVSGLNPNDTILTESKPFKISQDKTGANPFMPGGRRGR